MHKIFKNLSTDSNIIELVKYIETINPEIIKECVLSTEREKSFFISFSSGVSKTYNNIKYLYDISKKYGYTLTNSLNKNHYEINELEYLLRKYEYNETFLVECLNEYPKEEIINIAKNTNLLMHCFEHNKVLIIEELQKYPELWINEGKNKTIQEHYLKNLQLSELFYKNTNKDSSEHLQQQCKEFIIKEIKYIDKSNMEYKLEKLVEYLVDMSKKEEVFTKKMKEDLIGISLSSQYTKVTNSFLKVLFKQRLSTYKPDTPLWIHFENLKNKDILYQFLEDFHYADKWIDQEGKSHYKIDYLQEALINMEVHLQMNQSANNNKTKRDMAISESVVPLIKPYMTDMIDGKLGIVREILKGHSKYLRAIEITLPEDDKDIIQFLDNTLGYKENNELIVLKKIGTDISKIKNLELVFKKDLLKDEEIIYIVENYPSYSFSGEILNTIKQTIIDKQLIINIDHLLLKENNMWGENKVFLEGLDSIIKYNTMKKKFEHIEENKTKKAKI